MVELRGKNGWTQEQLSEKTSIGVKHLSSIENGRKEACLDLLVKLSSSFGITLSELLRDVA